MVQIFICMVNWNFLNKTIRINNERKDAMIKFDFSSLTGLIVPAVV